jgi:hypothetical protein
MAPRKRRAQCLRRGHLRRKPRRPRASREALPTARPRPSRRATRYPILNTCVVTSQAHVACVVCVALVAYAPRSSSMPRVRACRVLLGRDTQRHKRRLEAHAHTPLIRLLSDVQHVWQFEKDKSRLKGVTAAAVSCVLSHLWFPFWESGCHLRGSWRELTGGSEGIDHL